VLGSIPSGPTNKNKPFQKIGLFLFLAICIKIAIKPRKKQYLDITQEQKRPTSPIHILPNLIT
jgi:hypothetical protein